MSIHPERARRKALQIWAVAGAGIGTTLAFGVSPALASPEAHVQAGTLQITGTGASDKIALRLEPGSPNILQVDLGENGTPDFSFDRSTFTAVDVRGGAGRDDLRVDDSNGSFADEAVTLDGGSGDDTLIGGDGNDVLVGGSGDDTLVGGDGNDLLIGGSGNDVVIGGRGIDTALLGSGDDTFTWNPGDGSDIVEGQSGRDALIFNGANVNEKMAVSANGSRVLFTRDVGNITMDLDGIEALDVNALGGADTITVNDLTGTDLKAANIDLGGTAGSGVGDGQADTVIVNGTDGPDHVRVGSAVGTVSVSGLSAQIQIAGSEAANDQLQINTLGGKDSVAVAPEVSQLIQPVVDLGADQ